MRGESRREGRAGVRAKEGLPVAEASQGKDREWEREGEGGRGREREGEIEGD